MPEKSRRDLSPGFTVRPARAADLQAVTAIEGVSFTGPWPREIFERELANRWSHVEVVEDDCDQLVAYLVYWVVHDELHILNIAVHPEWRRRGLARALLAHLDRVCEERELTYLTLEVRVSNAAAIALYETHGFDVIHQRKNYYVDDPEDALVMAKALGPEPVPGPGERPRRNRE